MANHTNYLPTSDNFRMFFYKVTPCHHSGFHDMKECPYLHPGEDARRRDPILHSYSSKPCEYFKEGFCLLQVNCPLAHGMLETGLHPDYYRTHMCRYGANCTRRLCFYAHTDEELRHALPSSPRSLNSSTP